MATSATILVRYALMCLCEKLNCALRDAYSAKSSANMPQSHPLFCFGVLSFLGHLHFKCMPCHKHLSNNDLTAPYVTIICVDVSKHTWHSVHKDCWNALQDKVVIPDAPRRDVNGLAQSLTHVIHKPQKSMHDGLCIATSLHNNR